MKVRRIHKPFHSNEKTRHPRANIAKPILLEIPALAHPVPEAQYAHGVIFSVVGVRMGLTA